VTILSLQGSPPVIEVLISPAVYYQDLMRARGMTVPSLTVPLLVDTGASHTAIDHSQVSQLGIPNNGYSYTRTLTNGQLSIQHRKYDLSLLLMGPQPGRSYHAPFVSVTAPDDQPFNGASYAGLLGRDVLDLGHLTYDGNGKRFTLCF
jgi:hypothetical protein